MSGPVLGGPTTVSSEPVHTVLVVSKSHLDVGFTDLAGAVRERWLRELLPAAISTAAALRERDGEERLCWSTGSWILAEALEDPDRSLRSSVELAIEAGDLTWHALPFTTHTELADRSLLRHGLSISGRLDEWFERTTRAAKLTDVPGHTRALVSLLAEVGVDFLHVGVNPAASAPAVPATFRWRDDAAATTASGASPELNVMYQAGSYGSVQVPPGTGTAIVVRMTGDNVGPPSPSDVVAGWAELRELFPGARISAASLDDVADVMRSVSAGLPLVTSEIGDTWIHGIASDPPKVAAFRETCRRRVAWIRDGRIAEEDPALQRASTELLLVAEHTWGLDQKSSWPESDHWSEAELVAIRPRPDTRRFEWSWSEQRSYLDRFMDVLERAGRLDLSDDAREGMIGTGASAISVEGLVALHRPDDGGRIRVQLGRLDVEVDPHDGALVGLRVPDPDQAAGAGALRSLVDPGRGLGRVGHRTYDAADYERWFDTYNVGTSPEDLDWARWDNTKPGLERSAARSAWYVPDLVGAWAGRREASPVAPGADVLVVELSFSEEVRSASSAPVWVVVGYEVLDGSPDRLECWLQWVGKPAGRWPESTWWSFTPSVTDPQRWTMLKLGEEVSPLDVVSRGARTLHVVESVQHPDGVRIDLPDAPLVAPGSPSLLRFEDRLPDLDGGWHVCLYDNVWGTNFPMWCPGDARFRLTLDWGADRAGADRRS
ncbi:MAG: DUF5054 domain-containing protein [Actinobacteria bacterium]|nr:DUF5054 domain-containing protein [Actinomycetota bacterium]